jgi:hypothetical protein
MSEEKENTRARALRRAMEAASHAANILMAVWVILGLPSIVGLLQDGTLSGIQAALAWAAPTLTVWVLAWRRRPELARAMRRRYVSFVAWLASPAPQEVAERLRGKTVARVHEEVEALLEEFDEDILRTLQFALVEGDPAYDGPAYVIARQVFLYGVGEFTTPNLELEKACNKLVTSGMVVTYRFDDSEGIAQVWFRRDIREANETGRLSRLVREELKRRRE